LLRITIALNKSFQPPREAFAARFPGIYHLLARQAEQLRDARGEELTTVAKASPSAL
jgi:hypothetical protein